VPKTALPFICRVGNIRALPESSPFFRQPVKVGEKSWDRKSFAPTWFQRIRAFQKLAKKLLANTEPRLLPIQKGVLNDSFASVVTAMPIAGC
jgi:hypothetical protein